MEIATWILAAGSFLAGLWSAALWYRASRTFVMPIWYTAGQIEPPGGSSHQWTIALLQTTIKSSELNQRAAFWTAVTVILTGLTSLTGALRL